MKHTMPNLMKCAGIAVGLSCILFAKVACSEELTAEKNMEILIKKHIIPGKTLKATGPNYEFCEVATVVGTTEENAVANFYNPTGIDNCSAEDFAKIVSMKDQLLEETGAMDLFLNPSRHWTWDSFEVFGVGDELEFGPVKMVWMGAIPYKLMTSAVGESSYNPAQIHRNNIYVYNKGTMVYLIDIPESDGGGVMVMQSWTSFANKGETADNLKDLGSQFKKLPPGWKFRTKVLEKELTVAPPAPTYLAWVTMDEFKNTYQVCGRDKACNYTP